MVIMGRLLAVLLSCDMLGGCDAVSSRPAHVCCHTLHTFTKYDQILFEYYLTFCIKKTCSFPATLYISIWLFIG